MQLEPTMRSSVLVFLCSVDVVMRRSASVYRVRVESLRNPCGLSESLWDTTCAEKKKIFFFPVVKRKLIQRAISFSVACGGEDGEGHER